MFVFFTINRPARAVKIKKSALHYRINEARYVIWQSILKLQKKVFGIYSMPSKENPNPFLFDWSIQSDGYAIVIQLRRNRGDGNAKECNLKEEVFFLVFTHCLE